MLHALLDTDPWIFFVFLARVSVPFPVFLWCSFGRVCRSPRSRQPLLITFDFYDSRILSPAEGGQIRRKKETSKILGGHNRERNIGLKIVVDVRAGCPRQNASCWMQLFLRAGKKNNKLNSLLPEMARLGPPFLTQKIPQNVYMSPFLCVLSQEMRHINLFLGAQMGRFG